jgi:hypothetical protein
MAQLVRALCLIATQDQADTQPHMRWLLRFAKDRGPSTREAVLALYGEISENHAKIASGAIEELFDLAFTEPTHGSLIEKLQAPLFSVYQNKDPRTPTLAKALIDRSAPLTTQTCHGVCGTFKRLRPDRGADGYGETRPDSDRGPKPAPTAGTDELHALEATAWPRS